MNGLLVAGVSLLLILFINLSASIFITHETGIPDTTFLIQTVDTEGSSITVLKETPAPNGYTVVESSGFIREDPLVVVKDLSFIGLILAAAIDFWVVQWITNQSLRPIHQISQAAKQISARSLSQQLNYQGGDDEVKDLADAFDSMLERLEESFKQQSEFSSNLAHELRTPLTSMHMNVEMLRSDPQATLADYQNFAETLDKALVRLEYLVNDLLLLAKGEKEISSTPVVLGVMIEEIIEELSPLAQVHAVSMRITGDMDCEIWGDEILLHRAISNLVENSILYNRPQGIVEIRGVHQDHLMRIEIQDSGMGILPEDQERIFDRFYRSKSNGVNNKQGKGLGLAIAAHIVRLHQGHIEVESTLNVGSLFRIFLPKLPKSEET
jgi:heavy metal sensor kinase